MHEEVKRAEGHLVDSELAALIASSESQISTPEVEVDASQLPGISDVLRHLRTLRDQKTSLEATLSDLNKQIATVSFQAVQLMRDARMTSTKIEGIGTAYLATTVTPRVKDADAFMTWARENMPEFIRESIHPATLKSQVKERLETGQAMPPDEVMGVDYFTDVRLLRK